jgi:hypothetical protein
MTSLVDPLFGLGGVGGLRAALFGPRYFVFAGKVFASSHHAHQPDGKLVALVTAFTGVVGGLAMYVAWRLVNTKKTKPSELIVGGSGLATLPDAPVVAVHTVNQRMAEKEQLRQKLASLTQAMKVDSLLGTSPRRAGQRGEQDLPPLPDATGMQSAFAATKSYEVMYATLNHMEANGEQQGAAGVADARGLMDSMRSTALQVSCSCCCCY